MRTDFIWFYTILSLIKDLLVRSLYSGNYRLYTLHRVREQKKMIAGKFSAVLDDVHKVP